VARPLASEAATEPGTGESSVARPNLARRVADSVERLAYDEAVRGVEAQRASLDALRTRTGTLLAAAALVTTFIGGRALRGDNSAWTTVAIVTFVAVVVSSFVVLLPWKLHFALPPSRLIEDYVDPDPQATPAAMLRDLALFHETTFNNNRRKQNGLFWAFRCGIILLGLEVVSWLIELEKNG
jgi:hypothetical protein